VNSTATRSSRVPLRPESWAVLGTAVVGITAAVMAFLKTPPDKRLRLRPPTLEERLAACPPEEGARIVRGDWRRALRRDLPGLVALLSVLAFGLWLEATRGQPCAELFGLGRPRLLILALMVLVPVMVVVAGTHAIRQAIAVLRGGYWPPLDWAQYTDTLARGGRLARWRAIHVILAFALLLGLVAYGYVVFGRFTQGKLWPRIEAAEAACHARP
jgi:hypothetical protein